jgi:hypothetical protein
VFLFLSLCLIVSFISPIIPKRFGQTLLPDFCLGFRLSMEPLKVTSSTPPAPNDAEAALTQDLFYTIATDAQGLLGGNLIPEVIRPCAVVHRPFLGMFWQANITDIR